MTFLATHIAVLVVMVPLMVMPDPNGRFHGSVLTAILSLPLALLVGWAAGLLATRLTRGAPMSLAQAAR